MRASARGDGARAASILEALAHDEGAGGLVRALARQVLGGAPATEPADAPAPSR